MKDAYVIRIDKFYICIADLNRTGAGEYYISRINVPWNYRGYGHGSRLLDEICRAADEELVVLWLTPLATGVEMDGLTQGTLISWYKRRGFKWETRAFSFGGAGQVLVRDPQRSSTKSGRSAEGKESCSRSG